MDARILVAYASKCGSTGEVAEVVGEVLRGTGASVDVRTVKEARDLKQYDAVVVGSAIRMGKLLPGAVKFAKKHRSTLGRVPVAYFLVCLAMKEDTPENRQEAMGYLEPLLKVREPVSTGLFGGKVDHSKLSFMMRMVASKDDTGVLDEGDWRNWDEIRAWAGEITTILARA